MQTVLGRTLISRRGFTRIGLAAVVLPLVVACGGAPAAPTAAPTSAPKSAPQPTKPAAAPPGASPEPAKPTAATPPTPAGVETKPVAAPAAAKIEGKAPVKITYSSSLQGAFKDSFDLEFKEAQKIYPHITVTHNAVTVASWGEYFDKLIVQIAGGAPPDFFRNASEGSRLAVGKKLVRDIDAYLKQPDSELDATLKDIAEPLRNVFKLQGKQWSLPQQWNTMSIYYRTDMFQQAGLKMPTESWTWEEFLTAAQKLTKPGGEVYGFLAPRQYFVGVMPFIYNAGGDVLNPQMVKAMADTPEVVQAFQWYGELVTKHKVSPAPTTQAIPFESGKLAMFNGTRGPFVSLKSAGIKDYDIQYVPKGKIQVHQAGIGGNFFLNTSKYPDDGFLISRFLLRADSQERLVLNSTALSPLRSICMGSKVLDNPNGPKNARIYYEGLDKFPVKEITAPPEYNRVEEVILRELGRVLAGETNAKDALASAQKELTDIISKRPPDLIF